VIARRGKKGAWGLMIKNGWSVKLVLGSDRGGQRERERERETRAQLKTQMDS